MNSRFLLLRVTYTRFEYESNLHCRPELHRYSLKEIATVRTRSSRTDFPEENFIGFSMHSVPVAYCLLAATLCYSRAVERLKCMLKTCTYTFAEFHESSFVLCSCVRLHNINIRDRTHKVAFSQGF